jgi:hypothetical protein
MISIDLSFTRHGVNAVTASIQAASQMQHNPFGVLLKKLGRPHVQLLGADGNAYGVISFDPEFPEIVIQTIKTKVSAQGSTKIGCCDRLSNAFAYRVASSVSFTLFR